jgi:N-acetylneuraminate synthase
VRDLKAGDVLTRENVRAIRPGLGLPPKHLDDVLGKRVTKDVSRGTALSWELVG